MTQLPKLFDHPVTLDERAGHIAVFGASGTGKTRLLIGLCCARLADPRCGLFAIDVEGDIRPPCLEFAANPANKLGWRRIHALRPASGPAFAIPLLHVARPDPIACCQVSVRALSVFQQFLSFGMGEYSTPRPDRRALDNRRHTEKC